MTRRPEDEFRNRRACDAADGILTVMQCGKWIDRAFMINRFSEAGYCQRMAEEKADALIALNTDIRHWSRWQRRGDLYGYTNEQMLRN